MQIHQGKGQKEAKCSIAAQFNGMHRYFPSHKIADVSYDTGDNHRSEITGKNNSACFEVAHAPGTDSHCYYQVSKPGGDFHFTDFFL